MFTWRGWRHFLRPDWRRGALLALCSIITVGAHIQADGFSDAGSPGALAAVLAPLPLWEAWAYLMVPLAVVTRPLAWRGLDVLSWPVWAFAAVSALYFYLLACVLVAASSGLRRARAPRTAW